MKKILLTLLLTMFSIFGYSQNGLGTSVRDVREELTDGGYITGDGHTKDGTYYITGNDNNTIRFYYFNNQNFCFLYVFVVRDAEYSDYEKALFNNRYVRYGDKYYNGDFVAEIKYDTDYKIYLTRFYFKKESDGRQN